MTENFVTDYYNRRLLRWVGHVARISLDIIPRKLYWKGYPCSTGRLPRDELGSYAQEITLELLPSD
jgi:hypothetical protein